MPGGTNKVLVVVKKGDSGQLFSHTGCLESLAAEPEQVS